MHSHVKYPPQGIDNPKNFLTAVPAHPANAPYSPTIDRGLYVGKLSTMLQPLTSHRRCCVAWPQRGPIL